MKASLEQLRAYIECVLSSNMNMSKKSRQESINELTPHIVDILKEYGFLLMSIDEFNHIKKALDKIDMDKNMKKVLKEYNSSIEELMNNKGK